MDARGMRRICAGLVDDMHLPVPSEPEQLIDALCTKMSEHLGLPVEHRLVAFPPETTFTGMWISTDTANYVLCEENTSLWHRIGILAHEFWHMLAGHHGANLDADISPRLLLPFLEPETMAHIVAARSHCEEEDEQEANLFALVLQATVSRWLPKQQWTVPSHVLDVVGRLEASLGYQTGGRQVG